MPCVIGLLISMCSPKIKLFGIKFAKGFTLFMVLTFLPMWIIIKFYSFELIELKSWYAAAIRKYQIYSHLIKIYFNLIQFNIIFYFISIYFILKYIFFKAWIGFALGAFFAFIFRFERKQIVTICIG